MVINSKEKVETRKRISKEDFCCLCMCGCWLLSEKTTSSSLVHDCELVINSNETTRKRNIQDYYLLLRVINSSMSETTTSIVVSW